MAAPRRPRGDPAAKQFLFLGLELAGGPRRRHHLVLVRADDPVEEFALLRLTRHHDRYALADPVQSVPLVEAQLGLARRGVGPVAMETGVREDGADLPVEVDRLRGDGGRGGAEQGEQPAGRAGTTGRHREQRQAPAGPESNPPDARRAESARHRSNAR